MNFAIKSFNKLFSRHVGKVDRYYLFDDAGTNIFLQMPIFIVQLIQARWLKVSNIKFQGGDNNVKKIFNTFFYRKHGSPG
jgi:hypothetical protein